jgi:hypothetical protein
MRCTRRASAHTSCRRHIVPLLTRRAARHVVPLLTRRAARHVVPLLTVRAARHVVPLLTRRAGRHAVPLLTCRALPVISCASNTSVPRRSVTPVPLLSSPAIVVPWKGTASSRADRWI